MHRTCPQHSDLTVLLGAFGWPAHLVMRFIPADTCDVCRDSLYFEVYALEAADLAEMAAS